MDRRDSGTLQGYGVPAWPHLRTLSGRAAADATAGSGQNQRERGYDHGYGGATGDESAAGVQHADACCGQGGVEMDFPRG